MYPSETWDLVFQVIPVERYLSDDFFMVYESRMGGCGGYETSFKGLERGIIGAQLGLPLGAYTTTGQLTWMIACKEIDNTSVILSPYYVKVLVVLSRVLSKGETKMHVSVR